MEVVIVFNQQEHYVEASIDSDSPTDAAVDDSVAISLELLRFQLFSLLGVAPEEQMLLSSKGELLAADRLTVPNTSRPRLFLLQSSSDSAGVPQRDLLPPDWTQICTKVAFGDVPVVQPAFQNPQNGDSSSLICQACAQTCTTSAHPVTPMDWKKSTAIGNQFISEIVVVAGEIDVPAPSGFTKLPTDLNYSASGDHVYLCVKRGGNRALTQLSVEYCVPQYDTPSPTLTASKLLDVNCNSGNGSKTIVRVGYGSAFRKSEDAVSTLAITDISIVVGEQAPPSPAYIKVARDLNEGVPGKFAQPIYLYYTVAPLGGFVCDSSRNHSEFGECLFLSRHYKQLSTIADFDADRVKAATTLAHNRRSFDDKVLHSFYQQGQHSMMSRLQSTHRSVLRYESKDMQSEALKHIPVEVLHERARANPSPMPAYQDELVMQLLHWFKREFFSWMNQPKCSACGHSNTTIVRTEPPSTPEEVSGEAGRVEVYRCPSCGTLARFPRYNNPVKLLETRTGRCGEWANCFTLCCRAMGFEARYVLDFTDHVWTEVYSEHFNRWLHCDSCEDQLDCPLTYEVGWGKKLTYIFSFSHEEIVDTAKRYTQDWEEMQSRREEVSESWLKSSIAQLNQSILSGLPSSRAHILRARAIIEQEELDRGRSAKAGEVQGRVSGSAEWKNQRSEDGKSKAESGTTASAQTNSTGSTAGSSIVEVSQQLCKNMLLGCGNSSCPNPYCLHGRKTVGNMTEHAAKSIQTVASLTQKGFGADSLASLLCPTTPSMVQWFLLSYDPRLYLQLQDADSSEGTNLLIDSSGNENHASNASSCPLRKPFQVPQAGTPSFGMQLFPGQRVEATLGNRYDSYAISFLARIDLHSANAKDVKAQDILKLDINDRVTVAFRSSSTQQVISCELRDGDERVTATCTSLQFSFGAYAHVGLLRSREVVKLFINAADVLTLTPHPESNIKEDEEVLGELSLKGADSIASTQLPIATAIVSHFAVLPVIDPDSFISFCKTMSQRYVPAPPLRAFDTNGESSEKRCTVEAATSQRDYRVAKILLWGGEFFDGIQFVYEALDNGSTTGNIVMGPLVGNSIAKNASSTPSAEFVLLRDEYVTSLGGRKGAWTDYIRIETNFGRQVVCGGRGGGEFRVPVPATSEVRAISFSVGDHLVDAIAFVGESVGPTATKEKHIQELHEILKNNDAAQRKNAISTALKCLEKISQHPHDDKFQRMRANNGAFVKSIGALGQEACTAFMEWCGFQPQVQDGETIFVYTSGPVNRCSTDEEKALLHQRHAAEAHRRIHFLKCFRE